MESTGGTAAEGAPSRERQVAALIDSYLEQRSRGEAITDDKILAAHPDLHQELSQQLARLRIIDAAFSQAQEESQGEQSGPGIDDTTEIRRESSVSQGLRIRCPSCRHGFVIRADVELTGLECPCCRNRFSLAGQERETERANALATIANFELLERVGMGGFGSVWKARDTELDRIVALKIPRQGRLGSDDVDEFLHEARIAAQLQHPNIVRVFEVGRDQDVVYIVSEFMQGRSLALWSDQHKPSPIEVAGLMTTVCRALDYAHRQGVIHRDLKPGNILMDEDGDPHITDFGLARREVNDVTVTMDGHILGTPAYMPPEQAMGMQSATDRRSDIYSLGVMLFQLLTGEIPFRGNVQMLIHQAVHKEAPRLRSLNATIPEDLETICAKCLEKEPSRRYQSASALADEFDRFLNGEPIVARPLSLLRRTLRWCRRNPAIPGLYLTLSIMMIATYVGGWFWFQSAYRETDSALTQQSLTAMHFAADSVANTMSAELEDRMDLVERIARSPSLRQYIREIPADPELESLVNELNRPDLSLDRREVSSEKLRSHPSVLNIQSQLEQQARDRQGVFGWFILERNGLQIARSPIASTVGQNYAWRAYFHGGNRDFETSGEYLAASGEHLSQTMLSPAFLSRVTDRWVIAISTPIWAEPVDMNESEKDFLGIVAIMFELGHFATLPGANRESEFAVLADARTPGGAVIVQHPLHEFVLTRLNSRLPDRFHAYRIQPAGWQRTRAGEFEYCSDYHDPMADDILGTQYRQRWLAVKKPISLRARESGLMVIIQESYQRTIGDGLQRLRSEIVWLSGSTLGLVIVFVIPIWAVVMRVVRRSYS